MARRRYIFWNAATAALTAAPAAVTTGTSIKTMLQLKPSVNSAIIGWGYSFDAIPTALVTTELVTTGAVAATVTAFQSGDLIRYDDSGTGASTVTIGSTTASGYTATAEGTITTTRPLATRKELAPSYECLFPLDREPMVAAGEILRVRATTATAIGMTCWVILEE